MYSEPTSPPAPKKPRNLSGKIYQLVWRWHFWVGLLVSPFLITVAITGALYVFKDEIERYIHSDLLFVEPGENTVKHSALEAKIHEEIPGADLHFISVSEEPDRSWAAFIEIHDHHENEEEIHHAIGEEEGHHEVHYVYFDQYRGEIIGHHPNDQGFFRIILAIHRRLMAGTFGRYIIEIATSWGIVTVLSGLYLWWPRKKEKIKGVWKPRSKGAFRTILRDWHAIPGVYLSVFILAIMLTGLFFTNIWGTAFKIGTAVTGGFPDFYLSPPKSAPVEDHSQHTRISLDKAWETANQAYPFAGRSYGINLPHHATDDAFSITTELSEPFAHLGATFIDQYTGELVFSATSKDLPWQSHVILLFYPIHVGSIFGVGTKILAVLSCLILSAMCITGVWMWWRRRPAGELGAPKKTPKKTAPKWMAWLTIALAIFLPMVGLSLVAFALFNWVANITSKRLPAEA